MKINEKQVKNIVFCIVYFNLYLRVFTTMLKFPAKLSYINDVMLVLILIWLVPNFNNYFKKCSSKLVVMFIFIFVSIVLISATINLVPIHLVLWASRNVLRFFIYFIAIVFTFHKRDIEKLFKIFIHAQWINIVLVLYQFLILNLKQDLLGGIFGIELGGNNGLNIFLVIIYVYTISEYMHKTTTIVNLFFVIISTLFISAIAEIKMFFLEFVTITALVILLLKASRRTLYIVFFSIVGLVIGLEVLNVFFPTHYEVLVNLSNMESYLNQQGGGYNISRFGAFTEINDLFFKDNVIKNLLGIGFGASEYSSFDIFTSSFYHQYGGYNYRRFMHQMLFLETGYMGIASYLCIFIAIAYQAFIYKTANTKASAYRLFSIIFTLIIIGNIFYNESMRIEFAYLIFPFLAIIPILENKKRKIRGDMDDT